MKRKFLIYVIPSVLAMWIYSIYTMANGIFVAKSVGEMALVAVNISMPFTNATFAIAILFAIGTSTIVSMNLGSKNYQKSCEIFTMNTVILIILSIVTTIIVLLNLDKIAYFLGATENSIVYVKEYLGIVSVFCIFTMLSYYFEVLVKTDGNPHLTIIGVIASAVVNLISVYIFVFKLGFGVKGAALAAGLSETVETLIYVVHFVRRSSNIKFVRFKFDFDIIKRTMPIGFSDFVNELSIGFITFMFNRIILKNIGEIGIITYTVIMYVNNIVLMTMAGVSQGTQPLVSYYYGKNDKETYSYFLKLAVKTVAIISLIMYVLCMLFAEQINGLFISRDEIELFNYSVKAFRMYVLVYLVVGFNLVLVGFYSAIESSMYSMLISMGRGLFIIVLSMFLMTEIFGANGVWIASFVSEIVCLLLAAIIFIKYFYSDLFFTDKKSVVEYE